MPSEMTVGTSNEYLDSWAQQSRVRLYVGGGWITQPYWLVKNLNYRLGKDPSTATVDVSWPIGDEMPDIKGGTKAEIHALIGTVDRTIFTGRVTHITQPIKGHHLLLTISDDRYLLKGIPILGSFWGGGTFEETPWIYYRQAFPCWPNQNGDPNLLLSTFADATYPTFCAPYFGLEDGEEPPEEPTIGKASYWNVEWFMEYLRFTTQTVAELLMLGGVTQGPLPWQGLPDGLVWSVGIGAQFPKRKMPARNYDGVPLVDAMEACCNVGKYSLGIAFTSRGEGLPTSPTINVVNMKNTNGTGEVLYRPTSGDVTDIIATGKEVLSGSLGQDFTNLYTRYAVAGAPEYFEKRLKTDPIVPSLVPRWSQASQDLWGATYLTALIAGKSDAVALKEAAAISPDVFASWSVIYDYLDVVPGGLQRFSNFSHPILPALLSSRAENAVGSTVADQRRWKMPIRIELMNKYDDFQTILESDGLKIDADGTFWLSALRDKAKTFFVTKVGTPISEIVVESANLRVTLAVQTDGKLWAEQTIADVEEGEVYDGINIADDYERLYYADGVNEVTGKGLYQFGVREDSYPTPESVGGIMATDKTIIDDTALIAEHVKGRRQELGQINRLSRLTLNRICLDYMPGTTISQIEGDRDEDTITFPTVVVGVEISAGKTQQTTLTLA